ncbi:MAG: hypothetical protein AAGB22_05600 [Bacteroidota bacterium]
MSNTALNGRWRMEQSFSPTFYININNNVITVEQPGCAFSGTASLEGSLVGQPVALGIANFSQEDCGAPPTSITTYLGTVETVGGDVPTVLSGSATGGGLHQPNPDFGTWTATRV